MKKAHRASGGLSQFLAFGGLERDPKDDQERDAAPGRGEVRLAPQGRLYPGYGVSGRDKEAEMAGSCRVPHSGSAVTEKVGESVSAISAPLAHYHVAPVSNPNGRSVNVSQNRDG